MADEANYTLNSILRNFNQKLKNQTLKNSKLKHVYRLTKSVNHVIQSGSERRKQYSTRWWFDGHFETKVKKAIATTKPYQNGFKIQEKSRLMCNYEDAFRTRTSSAIVSPKAAMEQGHVAFSYD